MVAVGGEQGSVAAAAAVPLEVPGEASAAEENFCTCGGGTSCPGSSPHYINDHAQCHKGIEDKFCVSQNPLPGRNSRLWKV